MPKHPAALPLLSLECPVRGHLPACLPALAHVTNEEPRPGRPGDWVRGTGLEPEGGSVRAGDGVPGGTVMLRLLGAERGDAWLSRGPAAAHCITGVAGVGLPCPERVGAGVRVPCTGTWVRWACSQCLSQPHFFPASLGLGSAASCYDLISPAGECSSLGWGLVLCGTSS